MSFKSHARAKIVPPPTPSLPAPPTADPATDMGSTLVINRKGPRRIWIAVVLGVLVGVAIAATVIYRFAAGNGSVAASVAPKAAATHDISISPEWKNSCPADTSALSPRMQDYCTYMKTFQALSDDNDELRTELNERGLGGMSWWAWLAIAAVGALSVRNAIAHRKRKTT